MSLTVITGPMFSGKCINTKELVQLQHGIVKSIANLIVGDVLVNGNSVTYAGPVKWAETGMKYRGFKGDIVVTNNHLHIRDAGEKPSMLTVGEYLYGLYDHQGKFVRGLRELRDHPFGFHYREISVSGDNMITLADGHSTHNTSALITNIQRETYKCRSPIIIKYAADTRYTSDAGALVTHSGIEYNKVDIIFASSLEEVNDTVMKHDVIGIDEVQFFTDIEYICRWMLAGKHVQVAGLISDFRGKPFGRMPEVLAMATKHISITAVCMICQERKAMFNHRRNKSEELIQIGTEADYLVCCQVCLKTIDHPLNNM